MPKKTNKTNTREKKASDSRKLTDIQRATKRAEAILGDKVIFCEACKKPKMPDILRTGNPEREKGFCNCGIDPLYREEYCIEIVRWFKNQKDKILTDRTYYEADERFHFETPDGYDHGWLKSEKINKLLSDFPTFEEWSTLNDILERTRQDRAVKFPEFARSCEMCKQIQHYILVKWGLNWKFNANVVKLIGANFGLTEVIKLVDVDHTVTEDQMERIDRLLARNYREHGSAQ